MLYYRYRSGSELSIKELIYDELYFASQAECNDPYEGKIFAVLEKNEDSQCIRKKADSFGKSTGQHSGCVELYRKI